MERANINSGPAGKDGKGSNKDGFGDDGADGIAGTSVDAGGPGLALAVGVGGRGGDGSNGNPGGDGGRGGEGRARAPMCGTSLALGGGGGHGAILGNENGGSPGGRDAGWTGDNMELGPAQNDQQDRHGGSGCPGEANIDSGKKVK